MIVNRLAVAAILGTIVVLLLLIAGETGVLRSASAQVQPSPTPGLILARRSYLALTSRLIPKMVFGFSGLWPCPSLWPVSRSAFTSRGCVTNAGGYAIEILSGQRFDTAMIDFGMSEWTMRADITIEASSGSEPSFGLALDGHGDSCNLRIPSCYRLYFEKDGAISLYYQSAASTTQKPSYPSSTTQQSVIIDAGNRQRLYAKRTEFTVEVSLRPASVKMPQATSGRYSTIGVSATKEPGAGSFAGFVLAASGPAKMTIHRLLIWDKNQTPAMDVDFDDG